MSNRKASTSIVSFAHQIFRVERTPFQKQKASIPWPELPERLASNSSVHFPLYRNGSRSLVWPHITQEAFSMAGEACYRPTNITRRKSVKMYCFENTVRSCNLTLVQ